MSSGGSKKQTVTNKTEPWAAAQPHLKAVMASAGKMYDQGIGSEYHPYSTVVPFSNQTNAAMDMIENRARAGSPYSAAIGRNISSALNGTYQSTPNYQYLTPIANGSQLNGNPYMDRMFNHAADQITNQLNSNAALRGRMGSASHQLALQRQMGQLADDIYATNYQQERAHQLNAIGSLNTGYEADLARKQQAIGMAQSHGQETYEDAQRLATVGAQREELARLQLGDVMGRHDHTQQSPWDQLSRYNQIASGIAGAGQTNTTTQPKQKPNPILGGLGGFASGFARGGPVGGLIGGGLGILGSIF